MNAPFQPVNARNREIFMDVLRGSAIFGILIANLTAGGLGWGPYDLDTGPFLLPELDARLDFFYTLFIEGKFYSIFSLLFGWGIALQIQRGENKEIDPMPILRRRLYFMLLLGLVHMLIWPGDIVLFYAILSFILLPLRRFSNKVLLISGALLILLPIALYSLKMIWPWTNAPAEAFRSIGQMIDKQWLGIDSDASYKAWVEMATWIDIFKSNVSGMFYRFGYLLFVSRIPKVLGMFLIGFVLGRSGFYKNISSNKRVLLWIIGTGLLIGLPANYALAHLSSTNGSAYYQLTINGLYQTIAYALGVAPLALAYTGFLMLIFQTALGNKSLSILAPVGKMAFTNYIMHSLVCQFVFLGAGLGYGGQLGTFYLTVFGITLFILQIIGSTLWLKFYQFGPAEWIWRSLTYGKIQPLKHPKHLSHPD